MYDVGRDVFKRYVASAIYPESYELVRSHQAAGRPVVIVTSATRFQAQAVADALGVDHLICSEMEVDSDGRLTGNIQRPTCYGDGKRVAALAYAEANGLRLDQSWFYSDGAEDLPFLDAVAYPRPLNATRKLRQAAAERGWQVHEFRSRGVRLRNVSRTAGGLGAMVASIGAGIPAALRGDLDRARNRTKRIFGDLGTAAAGITLEVEGEHHLVDHRPCVFVFNHQSAVEPLLLCKLLRSDFFGIAKAELKGSIFRYAFDYAGIVYIERLDREKAVEALGPVVDALKNGKNVIIAPEGTRSPVPTPGPFKKGAFHIARQANVPIVPIVFHNSMDALPRKGRVVHACTVRVTVLPPVHPETIQDVGASATQLREQYLETLGIVND